MYCTLLPGVTQNNTSSALKRTRDCWCFFRELPRQFFLSTLPIICCSRLGNSLVALWELSIFQQGNFPRDMFGSFWLGNSLHFFRNWIHPSWLRYSRWQRSALLCTASSLLQSNSGHWCPRQQWRAHDPLAGSEDTWCLAQVFYPWGACHLWSYIRMEQQAILMWKPANRNQGLDP